MAGGWRTTAMSAKGALLVSMGKNGGVVNYPGGSTALSVMSDGSGMLVEERSGRLLKQWSSSSPLEAALEVQLGSELSVEYVPASRRLRVRVRAGGKELQSHQPDSSETD